MASADDLPDDVLSLILRMSGGVVCITEHVRNFRYIGEVCKRWHGLMEGRRGQMIGMAVAEHASVSCTDWGLFEMLVRFQRDEAALDAALETVHRCRRFDDEDGRTLFFGFVLTRAARQGDAVLVRHLVTPPFRDAVWRTSASPNGSAPNSVTSGLTPGSSMDDYGLTSSGLSPFGLTVEVLTRALRAAITRGQAHVVDVLLAAASDIIVLDEETLVMAASGGDLRIVAALLSNRRGLPASTSALVMAASQGHVDVMNILMTSSTDWTEYEDRSAAGESALIIAALNDRLEAVLFLLDHPTRAVPPNCRNGDALVVAAAGGFVDIAEALMDPRRPGAALPDCQDHRALVMAAANGHMPMVRVLTENRDDDDRAGWGGNTGGREGGGRRGHAARGDCRNGYALILACIKGHVDVARYLLSLPEHPARANCMDNEALFSACAHGRADIAELLLGWPSNPARADCRNGEALVAAIGTSNARLVRALCERLSWPKHHALIWGTVCTVHPDMLAGLLDVWPDLTDGWDLLTRAIKTGNGGVVRAVLDASGRRLSAPPSCASTSGLYKETESVREGDMERYREDRRAALQEALALAAERGAVEVLSLLLHDALTPPRVDGDDCEAVRRAILAGQVDALRFLLSWPVHAPSADDGGGRFLIMAADAGREDVVRALLQWSGERDGF